MQKESLMMNAARGDKVTIAYELLTEEGVFDSSERSGPRTVTIGKGETLDVFESALIGMVTGERKTVHVPAEKGYGLRDESRVFVFHRSRAPQGFDPPVGERVEMFRADGERVEVTVLGKSEDSFTMDANHPLAGKDLDLHVTVLEILKGDSQ